MCAVPVAASLPSIRHQFLRAIRPFASPPNSQFIGPKIALALPRQTLRVGGAEKCGVKTAPFGAAVLGKATLFRGGLSQVFVGVVGQARTLALLKDDMPEMAPALEALDCERQARRRLRQIWRVNLSKIS